MFPTNNSYYSSTSYPHSSSHCRRPGRSTGGGRNPPKRDRGSSGLPELTPHPWDPVRVPATETSTPLFLPPPLSLLHPALYLLALIFILLTPAGNTASLLVAPPSLSPPQSQQRRRPVQCRSHEGPISAGHTVRVVVVPTVQGGGGGGGAQNTVPCRSRDCAAARSGTTSAWSSLFWWVVSVISISCLLVRLARRSLLACPHFFWVASGRNGERGAELWLCCAVCAGK